VLVILSQLGRLNGAAGLAGQTGAIEQVQGGAIVQRDAAQ
jgi:hypothetical protein